MAQVLGKSRLDDALSDDEDVPELNENESSALEGSDGGAAMVVTNVDPLTGEIIEDLKLSDETTEKKKKAVRKRPFDEMLLKSDEGLARVYREFPRCWRPRGRGNEIQDLQKLVTMYTEWSYQLHAGYSFEDAIKLTHKLGSKREIRDRVAMMRVEERQRYAIDVLGFKYDIVSSSSPSGGAMTSPEAQSSVEGGSSSEKGNQNQEERIDNDDIFFAMLDDEEEEIQSVGEDEGKEKEKDVEVSETGAPHTVLPDTQLDVNDEYAGAEKEAEEEEEEMDFNLPGNSSGSGMSNVLKKSQKKALLDDSDSD